LARVLVPTLVFLLIACLLAPAAAARPAYVANYNSGTGNGSVTEFDTGPDTVGATIPISGGSPVAVAITPDATRAYVVDNTGFTVRVIDTRTNQVIGAPIPVGDGAGAIAITPSGQFAYVTNRDAGPPGTVSVISTASNTVEATIPVGINPKGVAITPDGRFAYVTNGGAGPPGTVSVIDTSTNSVVGSPIPVGDNPFGLGVTPDGSTVYVANKNSGTVSPISTVTNVAGPQIDVGSTPYGVSIHRNGNFVYVVKAGSPNSTIGVINTANNSFLGSPITTGDTSLAIALTPSGRSGYVTNGASDSVSVFDTTTNAISGSPIGVGNGPIGIAIEPEQGPIAAFTAGKGAPGKALPFSGTGSSDPDGKVDEWDWNFGDGTKADNAGATPSHTYSKPGTYQVTLTVFDNVGCSTKVLFTGQTVYCNGNPAAKLTQPVTVPKNNFSFGKLKRNKKKGTATQTVKVPGPGKLKLTGSKVKTQRQARAASFLTKNVKKAGKVKLKVIAKGKAKKKLRSNGSVKVKIKVTFTPKGGLGKTKSKKIKLIRKG
jgi:YVTN family beta-propeller protein